MAIIEIIGGPITHKYLMGKTKHELADMYMRLLRDTARDAEDAERYRWLRDQASWWLVSTPDAAKLSVMLPRASIDAAIGTEGCDFDAAIDSAMQQGGGS